MRVNLSSVMLLAAALGAALGCSSDEEAKGLIRPGVATTPTGSLGVSVGFPTETVKTATSSIHVWVVASSDSWQSACNQLIGGSMDPYDATFERRGDAVSKTTDSASLTAGTGKAVVYVEAVDYGGNVEYAGCAEVTVPGSATVALQKAKVFDCAVPGTKDGSACDDAKFCSVGETCKSGVCQGGTARPCSIISNDCKSAVCDEPTQTCKATTAPDGQTCDDGLYCTSGDTCAGGQCVGKTKDCVAEAGPCRIPIGVCSETSLGCQYDNYSNYGLPCDDQKFCTVNDACDTSGKCTGELKDCSNGGCSTGGTCDEITQKCVGSTPTTSTSYCNDGLNCTTNDMCDGAGKCAGTPVVCSTACATCSETTGYCSNYLPVTTLCNDNNDCTLGDHCSGTSSTCTYTTTTGTSTACVDGCYSGTCTGSSCYTTTYAVAGTACTDGSTCTTNDQCDGYGYCTGTSLPVCP